MDQRKDTQRTGQDIADDADERQQAQSQVAPDTADQTDNAEAVPMERDDGAMPAP